MGNQRKVKFLGPDGRTSFVLWVSSTQDCGHEVFQINTKDPRGLHNFTAVCRTCGIRQGFASSAEGLQRFEAVCVVCHTKVSLRTQPDSSRPFYCKVCSEAERQRRQADWEQRQRERAQKQAEWEARQQDREEKQRRWEAQQWEQQRKREQWLADMRSRISQMEASIERLRDSRKKDDEAIRSLFVKLESIRLGSRAYEIRDSLHAKIRAIEQSKSSKLSKIEELQAKITETRRKMNA